MKDPNLYPPVKWLGGKRQVLSNLTPLLPISYDIYVEPFMGGGAMLFNLAPERAIIADHCLDLMSFYVDVKESLQELIDELNFLDNFTEQEYYKIREAYNSEELLGVERSAVFLFLNKTGRSGLYRVNRGGEFNVPYGKYTSPTVYKEDNLRAISRYFNENIIDIEDASYERVIEGNVELFDGTPGRAIFFYLDPPYYGSFGAYTPEGFGHDDHLDLSRLLRIIDDRGHKFLLTNSEGAIPLYHEMGFNMVKLSEVRTINSSPDGRGNIDTIALRNYS